MVIIDLKPRPELGLQSYRLKMDLLDPPGTGASPRPENVRGSSLTREVPRP